MIINNKTAFVCFYPAYPVNSGAGEISYALFESWPAKAKKIFQLNHNSFFKNKKNIHNIGIFSEHPIFKIFAIIKIIFYLLNYFKKIHKPIVIIEGASWIGYSYFFFKILKFFLPKALFLYHGHNIEYEIRKQKSSFIVSMLTKFFEKSIYGKIKLSTVVSKEDAKKIYKYYKLKPLILSNGIHISSLKKNIKNSKKIKLKYKKYIIYTGSYGYLPNKIAIDRLVNEIMPNILKFDNTYKLILTGSDKIDYEYKWLIKLGKVNKSSYIGLLRNATCMIVPLTIGFGSRVKIIEGLILGLKLICTKKAVEGLYFKKKDIKILNNNEKIINQFKKNTLINKDKYSKFYENIYSMERITKEFLSTNYFK